MPVLPADAGRNVRAWQRRTAPGGSAGPTAPGLRVAVLASFTADPLVPHLGTPLHDAGTRPELFMAPFNQIAQECLRDDSATARFRPDALVVCARPEDRPAIAGGDVGAPDAGDPRTLEPLAATALDAARRWGALLVWALPPLPYEPSRGVGDSGDPQGAVARAVASREAVRARLAADPGACVVDLEDSVRAVGVRHARHPALFRLARVPFTEDVFFRLGGELARILLARNGQGCHGVLADLDGLVLDPAAPSGGDAAAELAAVLQELPAGRRLAYRTGHSADEARRALATLAPALARLPAEWIAEGRTAADDLVRFARARGVTTSTIAVLTGPPATEPDISGAAPHRLVVCDGSTDQVRLGLLDAGAFDTVPPVTTYPGDAPAAAGHGSDTRPDGADTTPGDDYATFLRGLGVSAELAEPTGQDLLAESDVAARAHDFTLALAHTPERFASACDGGRLLLSARVRDRYGDYGTSAVIGVRVAEAVWHVELFSLSCVVMGKGVEDLLLRSLVDRAAERGATELAFHYRDTGRNHPAVGFLRAAAHGHRARDGRDMRVTPVEHTPATANDHHEDGGGADD